MSDWSADVRTAERILDGHEDAFRDLVQECQPAMLRLARHLCPSYAMAEEAVQEAWIEVLRSLPGYRGEAALRSWICRILVRVSQRLSRRERRAVPMSALGALDGVAMTTPVDTAAQEGRWATVSASASPRPEASALTGELGHVLSAAIARLSPLQRRVFVLRDVEEWDARTVAERLEISPNHQRVALHRARHRVRAEVAQYLSPRAA